MVQAEGGSPRRFRMLEALRDHGRARLDERAAEAAARRHATHFARLSLAIASQVDRLGAEAVGDPLVPYHWDIGAASELGDRARRDRPRARSGHGRGLVPPPGRHGHARPRADRRGARARGWRPRESASRPCAGRSCCCCASCGCRRSAGDRRGARADRPPRRPPGTQRAALVRGPSGAVRGRPRRGRPRQRRRLRGGACRTAGASPRRYAAWIGGTVERMRGNRRPRSSSSRRLRARHRPGRHLRARQPRRRARRGRRGGRARGPGRGRLRADARDGVGAPARRAQHLPAPRGGARRRARRRPGACGRARPRRADGARRDPVSIGPWHAPAARGDVALAAGERDVARAEYEQALQLALDVRAEVGPSLPVDARVALSHLRLAHVSDDPSEHHTRAIQYARASRAPASSPPPSRPRPRPRRRNSAEGSR